MSFSSIKRGQGEPLSGRLNAESGETFMGVISGKDDAKVVLASSSGYGFIAQLIDLQTKNKSGKAAIRVQENAKVLKPCLVNSENDYIAAITNQECLSSHVQSYLNWLEVRVMRLSDPKPSFESGEDFLQEVITLREGEELKLISGKRYFSIKYKDLENFSGNRGRRGNFLPKGFRKG